MLSMTQSRPSSAGVSCTRARGKLSWCTSLLYYVPARVAGTWKTSSGMLTLTQSFQTVSGTLAAEGRTTPVKGSLRGAELSLDAGGLTLVGTVDGDRILGAAWSAAREP